MLLQIKDYVSHFWADFVKKNGSLFGAIFGQDFLWSLVHLKGQVTPKITIL